MCEKCFEIEYFEFKSSNEFDKFLEEFNNKISKDLLFVEIQKYKTETLYVYNCTNCKTFWWLSEPDNHWRGYFLKEENAKKLIDKD